MTTANKPKKRRNSSEASRSCQTFVHLSLFLDHRSRINEPYQNYVVVTRSLVSTVFLVLGESRTEMHVAQINIGINEKLIVRGFYQKITQLFAISIRMCKIWYSFLGLIGKIYFIFLILFIYYFGTH